VGPAHTLFSAAEYYIGITVEAQSWEGKIVTTLSREKDGDYYEVWRKPHMSSGGDSMLLAKGKIKEPTEEILDRFAG